MVLYNFYTISPTQSHLSSKVPLCGKYGNYHPHFADEETIAHED